MINKKTINNLYLFYVNDKKHAKFLDSDDDKINFVQKDLADYKKL